MSRSQMKYHPDIGFKYMPNLKTRVPAANGGGYLIQTNAMGYRANSEFIKEKGSNQYRVLLFGDSQTAGDGVSNAKRYSDLLNAALPQCEIFNYGISGTGTDQHYLNYQDNIDTEHDLVVIGLYVENIRRICRSVVKSLEHTGEEYYFPKPYFKIEGDHLSLHNVPVPKDKWTVQTLPKDLHSQVYSYTETNQFNLQERSDLIKHIATAIPFREKLKRAITKGSKFQPLPDYGRPESEEWQLMKAILADWIEKSRTPVLIVTIPHYIYFEVTGDVQDYQTRFQEFSEVDGCYLYDLLPDFWALQKEERLSLWNESSGHFSPQGHQIISRLLQPVIEKIMATRVK